MRVRSISEICRTPAFKVFLAALAIFFAAAVLLTGRLDPTGDEPAYLLLADSLLFRHDLDLTNSIASKDYQRFLSVGNSPQGTFDQVALDLHTFDYTGQGRLSSVHNIGTPAIIVPAYAFGGRLGASLFMSLLAALFTTEMYSLCRRYARKKGVAMMAWAPLALSIPLFPYSSLIYPEVPAALIILTAWILAFEFESQRPRHFFAVALLVGALPWFHVKYLAASLAILVVCVIKHRRAIFEARNLIPMGIPIASSLALLAVFFNYVYGSPSPFAPYAAPVVGFHPETFGDGMAGLWLDQEFGLLTHSPVYLFGLLGVGKLVWDRKYGLVIALAVVFGSVYLPSAAHGSWWAGQSFPVRFFLPVLPVLSIPTAYLLSGTRTKPVFIGFGALAAISITVAMFGVVNPRLLLDDANGTSKFWAAAGQGRVRLERLLPNYVRFRSVWGADSLPHLVGEDVVDPYANSAKSRFSRAGSPPGFLIYGPYASLKEGRYKATFYMKADAAGFVGPVANIDVSATPPSGETNVLAFREIPADAFWDFPRYQEVSLYFAASGSARIEFRVVSLGKADLWIEAVQVWEQ
ncbi:MAG: hypothetical protein Q7R39_10830 [Dehalococcoidia bacterium]|nr:hypothetical protein [Dehalococcoidia bacterium]